MRINQCRKLLSGSVSQKIQKTHLHEKAVIFPEAKNQFKEENFEWDHAKPYSEIPGPRPYPVVGNMLRFMPYIGKFGGKPLITQMRCLRDTYGDIVKLEGIMNRRSSVFLFSPELCEKMYRVQGIWPTRISMEALHHYRENRDCFYKGKYGLTTTQGKEWHDFRSNVNQHMMQPRAIKPHISQINGVTDDFVMKMRKLRDPNTNELPPYFNNEMNKWALESICSIALNRRLGCLESNLSKDSEPQKMINSVQQMFHLLYHLELLPSMWKIYNTSDLKKLFKVLDTLNNISIKYINQENEKLSKKPVDKRENLSILEKLLYIDEQTARVMTMDMLTAGVDTTGNASGAALYYLATNPRVQEKLRKSILKLLPDKTSPITYEILNEASYVKACVKETLRLAPITVGVLRTMPKDVVIGPYQIPEGVDVIACHSILATDESQFSRSIEYIPERWMKDNCDYPSAKEAHPFAYMPFGFGSRTCIGRRFAELEMEVLVMKIIRNFQLEWHHGPLEYKSRFINTIGSPLQLKLIDYDKQ